MKQDTGTNLHLDDVMLHQDQLETRKSPSNLQIPDIKIGDTVTPIAPQEKHNAQDIYIITDTQPEKVTTQRILHLLSDTPTKLMGQKYEVHPKHLQRLSVATVSSSFLYPVNNTSQLFQ